MINVVNKRTHKPTDRDVYIGRPTPVSNPFTHLKDTTAPYKVDTRDQAIDLYRPWFKKQLLSNSTSTFSYMIQKIISMAASGDVNLVCWCHPNKCHGEIIKEYVEKVLNDKL